MTDQQILDALKMLFSQLEANQIVEPDTLPFDTELETPKQRVHKNKHCDWTNEKMALIVLLRDLGYTSNEISDIAKLGITKWAVNNRLQTIKAVRIQIEREPRG